MHMAILVLIGQRSRSHVPELWPPGAYRCRGVHRAATAAGNQRSLGWVRRRRQGWRLWENGADVAGGVEDASFAQQLDRVGFQHRIALPQSRVPGVEGAA